jgi:capsular exopolysaccharide synthesis family protein
MSKIHDALKKIQQERAAASPEPELSPIGPETQHSTPSPSFTQVFDDQILKGVTKGQPTLPSVPSDAATPALIPNRRNTVIGKQSEDVLRVEELDAQCAKPAWRLDPNRIVFCDENSSVLGAEQFRTLRARLLRMRDNQTLKKLHITSAIKGEGKTFVASNLAQAFAKQGSRRVLLIDADLRNPGTHTSLNAPLAPGLSDYLRGDLKEPQIVQRGLAGGLYLIPAGNAVNNPSELLSNGRLKLLVDRLAPLFDWVIIDSPPCLPVADASLISTIADGVLLVVRSASTPFELSKRAQQELQGRNIVGVVLNAVAESTGYNGYYGYGYGTYEVVSKNQSSHEQLEEAKIEAQA